MNNQDAKDIPPEGNEDLLTIGQVSELLGISMRTLRHWEAKGLIAPPARSWGNYRLYDATDLQRLQQILIYRATGMSLEDISQTLGSKESPLTHLKRQLCLLQEKQAELTQMMAAVEKIMEGEMHKTNLNPKEIAQILGEAKFADYAEEAQKRWGGTPDWEVSQRRAAQMSRQDWEELQAANAAGEAELVAGFRADVAPGTKRGNELAAIHRATIGAFYEVTPAKQVILARMYLADPRFQAHYENLAEGLTQWLVEIIEAAAAQAGVDLENPQWE